jgi:branched-chain amino acid transport system permease protein
MLTEFLDLLFTGILSGLLLGLAALAVTLVFGIARFPNAATGDVMTAGAYVAISAASASGSLLLGGVAGVLAGAVVGVLSYVCIFRMLSGRSSVSALLASIGLGFLLRAIFGLVFGMQQQVFQTPLVRPWRVLEVRVQPMDLQLAGVALATLAVAFLVLHATPIGRRMRAVADDPALARISGIAPAQVMIALWVLAGGVAAVAGIMLGIKTVVTQDMGWNLLLGAFAAAVLGGIGHPVGAVVAGLLLGIVQELATPFVGFTYKLAIAFLVLMLVLLFRPRGLFGRVEGVR